MYAVTAIAVDPETAEIVGSARTEEIDTKTNELFSDCTGPWEVEDAYERFWNRLNWTWETEFPRGKEKVKVISVVRA